ncbi:MAG: chorismate synthase [Bacteroidota bacterium]|nr:chorismate synthase [Bacteroidota bacterium]
MTGFGESHGSAIGAVIDGCPAGIHLTLGHINHALQRRRPGQSPLTSARAETDEAEILSGVFEDRTLGTPIAVLVRNTDARSEDYTRDRYRIGHADRSWEMKYGHRDYRGGGRSSGRETVARVIGGAVAERILPADLRITGFARQIGHIAAVHVPEELTREVVDRYPTRCPDAAADVAITEELLRLREQGDSVGGIVELRIDNVPAGLGEPVFHKLESALAAAVMSIGAISGVAMGDAFTEALMPGSAYHQALPGREEGIALRSHGIQGGISTGAPVILRCAVKPTSTIGSMAREGRHDPCIIPRIIPVIESMAALVLADHWLLARMDRI